MARTEDKTRLNEAFAQVAKGLAHANRIELLELLAQGERDVDSLSQCSGLSVANTSHHLRLLRQCGLIRSRQEGQRVIYRLCSDEVVLLILQLHRVAVDNLPELDRLLAERFPVDRPGSSVSPQELARLLHEHPVRVLDLRPAPEYAAGHVPGAQCHSLESLQELPAASGDQECVVYCRGAFCLAPYRAAEILAAKGYCVRRLEGGFPAWRISGLSVEREPGSD
ncbi:MAG: ArsR/SmtB family transcription factor [Desulfovibrio sp.]